MYTLKRGSTVVRFALRVHARGCMCQYLALSCTRLHRLACAVPRILSAYACAMVSCANILSVGAWRTVLPSPACCGLYKHEKQCIFEKRTMRSSVKIPLLVVALAIVAKAQWTRIPGALIHTSANVNYVWGVNEENEIYMCRRPCTGRKWKRIDGALKQLDADDHEVWGLNSADQIWKRPVDGSNHWQLVEGSLKHVSASGHGYVWGVNRNNRIFKYKKPCLGDWVRVPGTLQQIDGGQRYVYGVNSANNIFTRPVDGGEAWRRISPET